MYYSITDDNSESSSEEEIEMTRVRTITKEDFPYTQTKSGKTKIEKDRLQIQVIRL